MNIEESPILLKTRELCETILEQPNMHSIRERIDAFMADDKSRSQYDGLLSKGQALQEKQQTTALTGEEISEFEEERDALLQNPVARGFLDAQEELRSLQQTVQKYIGKTFELRRMPTEEDLNGGCCDHGCSCGH